jgi:uncharacterized secreted protein with C-terminal beta-propeller domain
MRGRGGIERRIIYLLAGPIAGKKISEPDWEWDVDVAIHEIIDELDIESEWVNSSVDVARAYRSAMLISNRTWTPLRILRKCERWTKEMLSIPEVWDMVESVADRLQQVGEIQDFDEYKRLTGSLVFSWIKYPTWKRRFMVTIPEMKPE